jgi:hypothetical protein
LTIETLGIREPVHYITQSTYWSRAGHDTKKIVGNDLVYVNNKKAWPKALQFVSDKKNGGCKLVKTSKVTQKRFEELYGSKLLPNMAYDRQNDRLVTGFGDRICIDRFGNKLKSQVIYRRVQ